MIIIKGTIVASYTNNSIYRGCITNVETDSDVKEVKKQIEDAPKRKSG